MNNNFPIDIVIAWVDGNDPLHMQKMSPFLDTKSDKIDFIAGATRYRSAGEIYFCVASILKFAPFVRTIFIITDEQNPNLDDFLKEHFPNQNIDIKIIDHKVIFAGYEQYLPIFNSRAIESMLFRIPDLSENFVYFNDDVFLLRPVQAADWFVDNKIVTIGQWRNIFFDRLLRYIAIPKEGIRPFGFKFAQTNAAQIFWRKSHYFHMEHTPHARKKSVSAMLFEKYHEHFLKNISYKFRDAAQFNPQELFYLNMFAEGRAVKDTVDKTLYIKPVERGDGYIARKIGTFNKRPQIQSGCIGSLDLATEADQNILKNWLTKIILEK
ncbi:MAG: Stealth CR1 domain-containing protein [Prevotellaceae bacterium]|jgi:hypothetical protein|nr:Stealth CR1 domain-containing protein [Prevotellaceae bacterium]